MKSVSETRLLSLFGSQGLCRLQIEIVIQMQIIQIFAVNEKIKHVVSLTTNLQASFDPVELSHLEELSLRKGLEE